VKKSKRKGHKKFSPGATEQTRRDKAKKLLKLGEAAENSGDIKGAKCLYHQALDFNSNLARAHMRLSNIFRAEGKIEEAENHLALAIQIPKLKEEPVVPDPPQFNFDEIKEQFTIDEDALEDLVDYIELNRDLLDDIDQRYFNQYELNQMANDLRRFSRGTDNLAMLKRNLNSKARDNYWSHTLGGRSGTQYVNSLVKYMGRSKSLEDKLRKVVDLPTSSAKAYESMKSFENYVKERAIQENIDLKTISPGRTAYLVSCFWYIQSPNNWPIFYDTMRYVFVDIYQAYKNSGTLVDSYFKFVICVDELIKRTGLGFLAIEALCRWTHDEDYEGDPSKGKCRMPQ